MLLNELENCHDTAKMVLKKNGVAREDTLTT